MVDLNKIRSLRTLEEIRKDLNDFLSNPMVPEIYKEDPEGEDDDYDADKEQVIELLEKVEHRIKSLGKFVARQNSVKTKNQKREQSPSSSLQKEV